MGLAMRLYLLSNRLYKMKLFCFSGILMRFNRVICSCDIPPSASIHKTVILGHNALGCVIHERAIIKENVIIMQNVTIGGRGQSGVPVINQGVFIGAGAKILGGIIIGENSKIGANSVVIKDVPPNATVTGIPGEIRY